MVREDDLQIIEYAQCLHNLFQKQKVVFSFKAIHCEQFVITNCFWLLINSFQRLALKQMAIKENFYYDLFLMQSSLKLLYSLRDY